MSSISLPTPRPRTASVSMPGDKSISHRAFMCASIAEGDSLITGANAGADVKATINALRAVGVSVVGDTGVGVRVRGKRSFQTPATTLDCGNSGSTMRMLAGLLAGRIDVTLDGDASLRRRPMERVAAPLRAMGADIETSGGCAPVKLRASGPLRGAALNWKIASAQLKSAVLLAGVRAQGPTVITEPLRTRDHTERMLRAMGATVESKGLAIALTPSPLRPLADYRVPGDFSAAFFFLAGAAALPGSRICVKGVGLNPTRTAALDVLRAMGAEIEIADLREPYGEPIGQVILSVGRPLRAVNIEPGIVPNLIDEIPAICSLAASVGIEFEVRGAAELRTKESDRIATTVRLLRAFGARAEELPDGITVRVGSKLTAPKIVSTEGDHRIGMSAAILALAARSRIIIDDSDCIDTSFPAFADVWRAAFC